MEIVILRFYLYLSLQKILQIKPFIDVGKLHILPVLNLKMLSFQKAVMGLGSRYNSKHRIKICAKFDYIVPKDYISEFDIEPVYHWLQADNPDKFVKSLPKCGEIYTVPTRQCCSIHKHYAEVGYGITCLRIM